MGSRLATVAGAVVAMFLHAAVNRTAESVMAVVVSFWTCCAVCRLGKVEVVERRGHIGLSLKTTARIRLIKLNKRWAGGSRVDGVRFSGDLGGPEPHVKRTLRLPHIYICVILLTFGIVVIGVTSNAVFFLCCTDSYPKIPRLLCVCQRVMVNVCAAAFSAIGV